MYGIVCARCKSTVHVCETERELRERMPEYLRDVRLKKEMPIKFHFGKGKHTENDLSFVVLERLYGAERIEK